jgi:hypothetical protein
MTKAKTPILDDLPTERDALDFTPYVRTLVCSAGVPRAANATTCFQQV